ncbi:DUF4112 domain-containing protein [Candidatus Peregrinibacteria bacterium]|nr:DUF4112 domain-containing protein [Candidatus Peregrinibacteria bacterium]
MKESAREMPEKMKVKMTPEELKRIEAGVKRAEKLADLLDDKYLDPIIGLFFPEGGDAATALAGLYILYEAKKANMSTWELTKMVGRTSFDFLHGAIPVVGDVMDFVYKSNKKNAEALRKHFEEISAGADMTNELEQDLVERERSKERKDLKGLKGKVEKRKKAV